MKREIEKIMQKVRQHEMSVIEGTQAVLNLSNVVGRSEQLKPNGSYYVECECGNMVHAREKNCKNCGI